MRSWTLPTILLVVGLACPSGGCSFDLGYGAGGFGGDWELFPTESYAREDRVVLYSYEQRRFRGADRRIVSDATLVVLWPDPRLEPGFVLAHGEGELSQGTLWLSIYGAPMPEPDDVLVADVVALAPTFFAPQGELPYPGSDDILATLDEPRLVYVPPDRLDRAPGFPPGYSCAAPGPTEAPPPLAGLVWADCDVYFPIGGQLGELHDPGRPTVPELDHARPPEVDQP